MILERKLTHSILATHITNEEIFSFLSEIRDLMRLDVGRLNLSVYSINGIMPSSPYYTLEMVLVVLLQNQMIRIIVEVVTYFLYDLV